MPTNPAAFYLFSLPSAHSLLQGVIHSPHVSHGKIEAAMAKDLHLQRSARVLVQAPNPSISKTMNMYSSTA